MVLRSAPFGCKGVPLLKSMPPKNERLNHPAQTNSSRPAASDARIKTRWGRAGEQTTEATRGSFFPGD